MSGHYQKLGIEFLYPENWRIVDEETSSWPRTVSVQNAGGAFWSVMVYEDAEPLKLTKEVVAAMQAEYSDLESSDAEERFDGVVTSGFDMTFYCLDFLVTARALSARVAGQTYLMVWQAEDRDFQQLEPVFRAISTSLFGNVADAFGSGLSAV